MHLAVILHCQLAVFIQFLGKVWMLFQEHTGEFDGVIELVFIVLAHILYQSLIQPFLGSGNKHLRRPDAGQYKQVTLLWLESCAGVRHHDTKGRTVFLYAYPKFLFRGVLVIFLILPLSRR